MNKMSKIVSALLLVSTIAVAAPTNETLVTVNGKAITQTDVDSALMNATQGRFNQVPEDKQAEFRKQVLEQLIAKELVFEDAKKTGILKSKDFIDEYAKVQERVKEDLAIQVWQKRELDKVVISPKETEDYYNNNKEEFNEKESVHARHILLKTEEDAKAVIVDMKDLKADALKDKFIELAKSKSTGPTGPKGGDLGFFTKGQMVPEFNEKVFSMNIGTITTEPVKTQFGFHVIYLEEKKPEKIRAFAEVKEFIEQRLKLEKFKTVVKDKMENLRKQATIK